MNNLVIGGSSMEYLRDRTRFVSIQSNDTRVFLVTGNQSQSVKFELSISDTQRLIRELRDAVGMVIEAYAEMEEKE